MAEFRVKLDDKKLWKAINEAEGIQGVLEEKAGAVASRANSIGAGFKTGYYYRDHKPPPVGGTRPKYGHDVELHKHTRVGLVYTGNYAAMKDNHEHNTLLKSL